MGSTSAHLPRLPEPSLLRWWSAVRGQFRGSVPYVSSRHVSDVRLPTLGRDQCPWTVCHPDLYRGGKHQQSIRQHTMLHRVHARRPRYGRLVRRRSHRNKILHQAAMHCCDPTGPGKWCPAGSALSSTVTTCTWHARGECAHAQAILNEPGSARGPKLLRAA